MSSQSAIYATNSDLKRLEEVLSYRIDDLAILASYSDDQCPKVMAGLENEDIGNTCLTVYLTRRPFMERVRMVEVPAMSRWALDEMRSPVVELARNYYDEKKMRRGRIFFERSYYGENERMEKDVEVSRFAKMVFATMKALFERNPETGAYWGREAIERFGKDKSRLS